MAVTQNSYTGNGTLATYSFTFPYLKSSDVKASINATVTTDFTLPTATTVQFNTPPEDGDKIKIYRETSSDDLTATFYAGSAIKSEDLNDNFTQNLYGTQEVTARYLSNLGGTMVGDLTMAEDVDIVFEGATDNAYETTLTVADPTADRVITLPNVTGTVVTTGDTGSIATAMIADDAISTAKIADGAARQVLQTAANGSDVEWTDNVDLPGTLDVTGAATFDGSVTASTFTGNLTGNVTGNTSGSSGSCTGNSATATEATNITVSANNTTDETVYPIFVDGATGTQGIESDTGLTYNPSTGVLTSTTFTGNVTGDVTGNVTGNVTGSAGSCTGNAATATAISAAATVTSGEQNGCTPDDSTYFTTSASDARYDARYFNISSGDTIKDGDVFPNNDTTIATTAAINDRIIDLVDDVGGFVAIASENHFPNTNPDVNDNAGTIVSIKELSENIVTGSGVTSNNSIAQTVGGTAVNITGLTQNTTYAAGFGMLVETTTTLNEYTFHRLTPKATEVTTVAGLNTEITTVAGKATEITTCHSKATEITTCHTNATAITNVGNSIANVNTVAGNLTNVNNFADLYQIASSDPGTDGGGNALADGDMYFNSSGNELKVYNGSAWQGGVTATGNLVSKTGDTLTGDLVLDNAKEIRLSETDANGSHYLGFKAPDSVTANVTLTLPDGAGSNGQYLKTNGSDTLSWGTISSTPEGTAILSTGESGGTKFLREDGDDSCSWQTIPVPTTITVADESSGTSCNVLFATAATGDLAPKTGTNLTFNSNTGILTATGFAGDITGNVTGNTSGSSGSCTGNAATATTAAACSGNSATATTATNASGLTGSPNITVGTIGCGAITGTSTVSDSKGNLRSIPFSDQTAGAYTLVAADAGKCIGVDASGVVIPNSVMSAGDAVTLVNTSGSNCTITASVGTLYNASDAATGNRTLAGRGMVTVYFKSATEAYIGGGGIS